MKCPECGVEGMIWESRTEVTGDSSPQEQTQVWTVLRYRCRNPNCPSCERGTVIGEDRVRIYPEGGEKG